MRRRAALTALTVLTAILLVPGVAGGTAQAREVVLLDARGDMWQESFDGDAAPAPAPAVEVGDVRRARFVHGRRQVVIRQRYVELRRIGEYTLHVARLESGSRRYREVRVEAAPGGWRGVATVFDRRGQRVGCEATHRIDYDRNVLVVAVPRTCLGTPVWVRATASSYWANRRRQVFLMDNPHHERAVAGTWTRWLRAG